MAVRCNALLVSCSSTKQDIDHDYDYEQLERKYKRCGVSFRGIGDAGCVLRMELENGSAAKLMLPTGLITSVKPQMWHGGTTELLHTTVQPNNNDAAAAAAVVRGGLSLALSCDINGHSWSPRAWSLHQVTGTPQDSIQVELISSSAEGDAEIKHIIGLEPDSFSSEIIVSNTSPGSSLRLGGSALCHLGVSTPDATYAMGLEGSDYFTRPPFEGTFSIIPPDFSTAAVQNPNKFWPFGKLFPTGDGDIDGEVESGEEDDNYKHLSRKFSRIYTSAPRSLTIIDRGRRNSVTVRRKGFKEVYMLSPGSEHELYSNYSYICIGHTAQLQPLILDAQTQWTGGLHLFNPNY